MSTTNPVFQVLVTSGNQAPLTTGTIADLAVGQIGVFSRETGAALSSTSAVTDFYLAVGINTSGGTTLEDINKSAGQFIQPRNVDAYDYRKYSAPQPKVVELTNFAVKCDSEYGVKVELRNAEIYYQYGYNMFSKTWVAKSSCCSGDCIDCDTTGDCVGVAVDLVNQINVDPDGLLTAELIDYTTTPGTSVVVESDDVDTWKAANADKCLGIRLTSKPSAIRKYLGINVQYYDVRSTDLIVTALDGFLCNGTVTTTQTMKYEEGSAYDIQADEYFAGGWNGKPGPYRTYAVTGLAKEGIQYFAVSGTKYQQFDLTYDLESQSNFVHYKNGLRTTIAIPCGDSTTATGLVAILDKQMSNKFAANAGAVGLNDCTGAALTSALAVANNGIKILA